MKINIQPLRFNAQNNEIFWKELYEKLGHLFYAVAFADGTVKTAEIEKLKKTVKECWVPAEESHDEFGSDAAFQIIAVFDWLEAEQTSNEKAYDVFAGFFRKNRKCFDAAIKENILQTVIDISLAFRGENKDEHALMKNLRLLLDKDKLVLKTQAAGRKSNPAGISKQ